MILPDAFQKLFSGGLLFLRGGLREQLVFLPEQLQEHGRVRRHSLRADSGQQLVRHHGGAHDRQWERHRPTLLHVILHIHHDRHDHHRRLHTGGLPLPHPVQELPHQNGW